MFVVSKLWKFFVFVCFRWELPEAKHGVSASTANELRQDRYDIHVNPEKLKAASEGLANRMYHSSRVNLFAMNALIFLL